LPIGKILSFSPGKGRNSVPERDYPKDLPSSKILYQMDIVLVPRFRKFLNQLADHGARGTVPAGDAASEAAAEATLSAIARSKSYWKRRIMGHISVALVSAIGDRIAGAPISYALRTARDSENFHAGAAAQILFMEPDTAGDFHIAPAPCAREAHMGSMNPVVGLLTT
jgi:hypothetical protein